ncbi:MAG: DUF167 domain-containing protein [Candidatus Xenobia bacterium]
MTRLQIQEKSDGSCSFGVRVHPRAKRTRVGGVLEGDLVIHLAAPPVDGKANEALREWLADVLGVRRQAVALQSGARARRKVLAVSGLPAHSLRLRLQDLTPPGRPGGDTGVNHEMEI